MAFVTKNIIIESFGSYVVPQIRNAVILNYDQMVLITPCLVCLLMKINYQQLTNVRASPGLK